MIESCGFLGQLAPAVYEVGFEVLRRTRRHASQTLWFWQGLKAVDSERFRLAAQPANVLSADCAGFGLSPQEFRHKDDGLRQHALAFNVGGTAVRFRWSQPGIFVESFARVPGKPIQPLTHGLGETISASAECPRWLRVRHVPAGQAELWVNGAVVRTRGGQGRAPIFRGELGAPSNDLSQWR